jgi:hypothetical protein
MAASPRTHHLLARCLLVIDKESNQPGRRGTAGVRGAKESVQERGDEKKEGEPNNNY